MTKQPFEHNCTKETPRESLFPCSRRPTLSASDFSVRSSLPYKAAHNIRPFNHKANGTVQCPLFEAIPQLCLDEFWSLLSLLRLYRPQFPPASWPAFIGVRLKIIQDDNVVKNINGYFYYTVLAHLHRFCISLPCCRNPKFPFAAGNGTTCFSTPFALYVLRLTGRCGACSEI